MAGAPFIIREMADADRTAWLEMRAELWPEEPIAAHAAEIDEWHKSTTGWGFVAELPNGFPVGFAEVALPPYANGCDSRPVAFLEGIWVRPACRRRGVGVGLTAHHVLRLGAVACQATAESRIARQRDTRQLK